MFDRLLSALVSLSLAAMVWIYARSRELETLEEVSVPVQIRLATGQEQHYQLEVTGPSQIPVHFTGPPARIRELQGWLQRHEFQVEATVTVPEARAQESRYSDTVRVKAHDFRKLPRWVTPTLLEDRNGIAVTLHRLVERRLPVQLEADVQQRLGQVTIEPATVLVRGPQEIVDKGQSLTVVSDLLWSRVESLRPGETLSVRQVPVVPALDKKPIEVKPTTVAITALTQAKQKSYEIEVPIQFLCPNQFAYQAKLIGDERASRVSLKLVGPISGTRPEVAAFVDLTRRAFELGLHEEPLQLQLPKEFQLDQAPPKRIAFQLVPSSPPVKPEVSPVTN